MRWLPQFRLETKLPEKLKPRFYYELHVRNTQRVKVFCWLGIVVFSLLLIIDYLRVLSGQYYESWVYSALLWNHVIGVFLFMIPLFLIRRKAKDIKSGHYNPGPIMNWALLVLILTLIGQTIFTYIDRESLVLYTIFILIANWAITLDHFERISFNLGSALFMICAILILGAHSAVAQAIHIFEIIGFSLLAFLFNTFDFNLTWKGYYKSIELAREKKRIENLEAIKTNLYTNLTHEFRTPLTVIRGMSDLARTYVKQKKWSELSRPLNLIDTHSDNILNLINQLLNLSQLESSLMTLQLHQKDVVKFSRTMMGQLEASAQKKNISFEYDIDIESLFMDFDEEKLQSVITNLISNAIKFNHEGGTITLRLRAFEQDQSEQLQIQVLDTGYGIGKEHLPYIFDRFYQADTGPTRKTSGTGIGLALTKELVVLMNGTIDVSSTLGEGTKFTIHLPVTRNATVSEIEIQNHSGGPQTNHTPLAFSSASQKPWLLIVEDNDDVRGYLAELLEQEYLVELAIDGNEGEQKAKDLIPDLIISDIMMPGKDGYSLCKELKQHEKTNHIPILLLTAKSSTQDRMDSWTRGADAYMTKPFEAAELKIRLRKLHEIRNVLREKYQKLALVNDRQVLRKESIFLHDLNVYIEEHLQDRTFSIENLAKALFMSRMQLHRKLKAMTSRSASNYVRAFKLYKAKPLLRDQSRTIADIAFDVGFEDPGYFTKAFQNEFGETPSQFRNDVSMNS